MFAYAEHNRRSAMAQPVHQYTYSRRRDVLQLIVEGIWDPFAESNFWFANLNWTPLPFLKPSSQVNNFTVFFHFFMGMSKSVFSICLG